MKQKITVESVKLRNTTKEMEPTTVEPVELETMVRPAEWEVRVELETTRDL